MEDNPDPKYYLSSKRIDGVLQIADGEVRVLEATKKGYTIIRPVGAFNYAYPKSANRRGRVIGMGQIVPTIDTSNEIAILDEQHRSRKLTPTECFRLQGFPDEYFDRAAAVCSDSQLYKQAGNAVTVNVVYEIAKRLEGGNQ